MRVQRMFATYNVRRKIIGFQLLETYATKPVFSMPLRLVGQVLGITETQKVCDMAYIFDVCVQVHACESPLSIVAALHLECANPNFMIHEHHMYARTKYNRELCIYDYQPENGKFAVPDLPGLDNELSQIVFQNCDLVTIQ